MNNKILYYNSFTSYNTDIFNDNQSNRYLHRYKIGKENILNMLCLGSTDHILYVSSNLADAAIFFSNKKIATTKIDNGYNSKNIFVAQVLWHIKNLLPTFLGGFKIR